MEISNSKFAAVSVQAFLLAANLFSLKASLNKTSIIISIVLIFSIFVLQALNNRFYLYFPFQEWAKQPTKDWDTYLLYLLTVLAFFFFILGVSDSILFSVVGISIIIIPGIVWKFYFNNKIIIRVVKKLKANPIIEDFVCPNCKGKATIKYQVIDEREGKKIIHCVDECGKVFEETCPIEIGVVDTSKKRI